MIEFILIFLAGTALGAGIIGIILVIKDKTDKPDGIMHIVDDTITLELKVPYVKLIDRDEVMLKVDYSQD